jgi:hypothetical protein
MSNIDFILDSVPRHLFLNLALNFHEFFLFYPTQCHEQSLFSGVVQICLSFDTYTTIQLNVVSRGLSRISLKYFDGFLGRL